jgi:ABC-type transport system involved in multi-copper enzyme maturation permease subunit
MSALVSWPIALATARERARSPFVAVLAGLTVVIAFGRGALAAASEGAGGFTAFWLAVLTFALGAGLIAEEVESGHAQLVLLRPLTRAAWFGGRLAGAALVLAAALSAASLAGVAGALLSRHPPDATALLADLIALPLAFIDLGGWLVALACVSVVSPGWSNVARVLIAMLAWGTLRLVLPLAVGQTLPVSQALAAVEPYLHPRSSTALAQDLVLRRPVDLTPLLWNLLWIAALWSIAVLLVNAIELARRRT